MPIVRAISGLIIYIASVVALTAIILLVIHCGYFVIEGSWTWLWQENRTHFAILVLVSGALANWFIEDECNEECKKDKS